ncbi:MAG: metal-dependent hydrolase [Thermoleophilaceae bacterium]|nr:metal-dependent hydrolase [Thermoleophilaceae bacterium]
MRRSLALGCLAAIAAADFTMHRRRPRWILIGLFDHPAHLATAGLLVLNAPPRPRRWTIAFLVGALLPDLDHLPLALRPEHPSPDDPRPVSHCLLAVAPVAALAGVTQSERLHGLAGGMAAHFLRDLGVGTGVPLLWPASARSLRVPYAVYVAGCMLLAGRAFLGGLRLPLGGRELDNAPRQLGSGLRLERRQRGRGRRGT